MHYKKQAKEPIYLSIYLFIILCSTEEFVLCSHRTQSLPEHRLLSSIDSVAFFCMFNYYIKHNWHVVNICGL